MPASDRRPGVHVLSVTDGDTLVVWSEAGNKQSFRLRLYGIDAPELDQAFGVESKNYLYEITRGKTFTLDVMTSSDRYGRTVGVLFEIEPRFSVNRQMVAAGMAYNWSRYGSLTGGAAAELDARQSHLGVWEDGRGQVRPWDYRAAQRGAIAPPHQRKRSRRRRANNNQSSERPTRRRKTIWESPAIWIFIFFSAWVCLLFLNEGCKAIFA